MSTDIYFPSDELRARNDALFGELVPATGLSGTLAGELVRASNRVAYRWYNDGDEVGIGYGNKAVNPAARFLGDKGDERVRTCVDRLWEASGHGDEAYSSALVALIEATVCMVESDPSLRGVPSPDFWDWADPELDVDTERWDEEEW